MTKAKITVKKRFADTGKGRELVYAVQINGASSIAEYYDKKKAMMFAKRLRKKNLR